MSLKSLPSPAKHQQRDAVPPPVAQHNRRVAVPARNCIS